MERSWSWYKQKEDLCITKAIEYMNKGDTSMYHFFKHAAEGFKNKREEYERSHKIKEA